MQSKDRNSLNGKIPAEIGQLTNLKELILGKSILDPPSCLGPSTLLPYKTLLKLRSLLSPQKKML